MGKKFGKILAEICDPYLNLFKKIRILRAGPFDFTPILAIGVLVIISSILQGIVSTRRFSVGIIIVKIAVTDFPYQAHSVMQNFKLVNSIFVETCS